MRPVTILFFIFVVFIINIADMTLPFISSIRFILVPIVEELAKAAVIYKLVQSNLSARAITCMSYGVVDGSSQLINFSERLNGYLEKNPNILNRIMSETNCSFEPRSSFRYFSNISFFVDIMNAECHPFGDVPQSWLLIYCMIAGCA
jgi:hypothetical protein